MKIIGVETIVLSYPLARPVTMSFGTMTDRTNVLIKVDTDEGISGIGETWTNFPHWAAEERKITVEKGIKPLLINENPLNISFLWNKLYRSLMKSGAGLQWGAKGPLMQAISGVDIALWDILGQKLDTPVYQILGGMACPEIGAYASGIGPRGYEREVQDCVDKGYSAFKLKVGFGKDLDLHNLETVRQIIGSRTLMIDANQGWDDAGQALDHLKLYERYDIAFIEEPVPADQLDDLKRVRESGIMPVAGGENVYGRTDFKNALTGGALDIVQPDVTKAGGLSESKIICDMGGAWRLPFAPHMYGSAVGLAASLHLLAAVPGGLFMEVDSTRNPLQTELLEDSFYTFEKGRFILSGDRPGLGIKLNMDFVKEFERR